MRRQMNRKRLCRLVMDVSPRTGMLVSAISIVMLASLAYVSQMQVTQWRVSTETFSIGAMIDFENFWSSKMRNASFLSPVFQKRPLVIWTNDYHIATVQDIRHLLEPVGVTFFDKSLTPKCRYFNSCADNLTVINFKNGRCLDSSLIPRFYEAYKNDWQMKQVDAFVCYHPTAMCQLFMPFNRSIITVASTRYENGRSEISKWRAWNKDLTEIAKYPKNIIAANNAYDANYIKYFTGLDAEVIPSYCGYTRASYRPTRPGFLLCAQRNPRDARYAFFWREYSTLCRKQECQSNLLRHFRLVYPHFVYEDIASHQGLVYIPYQVSLMSLFEQYRMNIPLFFPTIDLLIRWHLEHFVVNERSYISIRNGGFGNHSGSPLPPHPSQTHVPDPNDETNASSLRYWFQFADFYNFPYVTYYSSVEDLIIKLKSTDLLSISKKMAEFNAFEKTRIMAKWRSVLRRVASFSQHYADMRTL